MPPFKYNLRHTREKGPYPVTPRVPPRPSAHASEDIASEAHILDMPQPEAAQPFLAPDNYRDQDEGLSSVNQLGISSVDDLFNEFFVPDSTPPSPTLPSFALDTLLHNNNNNNNNNIKNNPSFQYGQAAFSTGDGAPQPVLASQSFFPTPHATAPFLPTNHPIHSHFATFPSALYSSLHGPVSASVSGITADMDAMSISSSALESVVPEDAFMTVPGDMVTLAVAIIVDLAIRHATRVGDRWLCPFVDCPRVDVSSKDSLRHHLHRIHYRPSERLLCPIDGCNKDFGYYLDLNRHHDQFHLRIGHVCPCTGKWYPRLETLKKRCRFGPGCPGAIDRRGATPDA